MNKPTIQVSQEAVKHFDGMKAALDYAHKELKAMPTLLDMGDHCFLSTVYLTGDSVIYTYSIEMHAFDLEMNQMLVHERKEVPFDKTCSEQCYNEILDDIYNNIEEITRHM